MSFRLLISSIIILTINCWVFRECSFFRIWSKSNFHFRSIKWIKLIKTLYLKRIVSIYEELCQPLSTMRNIETKTVSYSQWLIDWKLSWPCQFETKIYKNSNHRKMDNSLLETKHKIWNNMRNLCLEN